MTPSEEPTVTLGEEPTPTIPEPVFEDDGGLVPLSEEDWGDLVPIG